MSACRTMPGCFHDVSGELVWVGGDASPFPLACPGCLAFQHATVNLFPGRQPLTLIPCQMKGCRPQLPESHFVISGNKWTSPKSTGRLCIFLLPSGSWEVRRWVFRVEIVRRLIVSSLPLCWLMGEAKTCFSRARYTPGTPNGGFPNDPVTRDNLCNLLIMQPP